MKRTVPTHKHQAGVVTIVAAFMISVSALAVGYLLDFTRVKLMDRSLYIHAKNAAYAALESEQTVFEIISDDPSQLASLQGRSASVVAQLLSNSSLSDPDVELEFGTVEKDQAGQYQFTPFVSQVRPFVSEPTAVRVTLSMATVFGSDIEAQSTYAYANSQAEGLCYERYQACLETESEAFCRWGRVPSIEDKNGNRISKFPYLNLLHDRSQGQDVVQGSNPPSSLITVNLFNVFGLSLWERNLKIYEHDNNGAKFTTQDVAKWLGYNNSKQLSYSELSEYSCEIINFFGITLYTACSNLNLSANSQIHFDGPIYIGYQGTCIDGQTGPSEMHCLSTNKLTTSHNYPSDFKAKLDNGGEYSGVLTAPKNGQTYFAMTSCMTIYAGEELVAEGGSGGQGRGVFIH